LNGIQEVRGSILFCSTFSQGPSQFKKEAEMPLHLKDYEMKSLLTGGEVFDLIFLETSEELERLGVVSPQEAWAKNLPHKLEFEALAAQWFGWFESNIMSGRCGYDGGVNSSGHHVLKREKVFYWIISAELLEYYESERFVIRKEVYELVRRYAAPIDEPELPPLPQAEPFKDAHENAFIRDGDFWWITYNGNRLRSIMDIDGIGYIAYLLARPNEKVSVLDLRDVIKGVPDKDTGSMTASDAKEGSHDKGATLIDSKGVRTFLEAIETLQGELEEAGGKEEQEDIKEKIQKIQKYLDASTNNRGRGRLFVDESEKARQTITQCISLARRKIVARNKDLGEFLKQSIKGLIYKPEPDNPIRWFITP
jgi:hypothetical protein